MGLAVSPINSHHEQDLCQDHGMVIVDTFGILAKILAKTPADILVKLLAIFAAKALVRTYVVLCELRLTVAFRQNGQRLIQRSSKHWW